MFLHNWQFQFDYTTLNSTRHEASSTVMNYSNGVCVQHQMWTAHGERWCKLSRMFDVYYCSFLLDFCRKVLHIFTRNSYKLRGGKNNRSGMDYFHFTFWQKSKIANLFKFTFFKSNEAIFSTFREMWGMCIKITWAPNALPINPVNITGATWLQCSSDPNYACAYYTCVFYLYAYVFFTLRKSSVFRQSHRQVCDLQDVYCLKRSKDLVEKMTSPVIFDTNRSFKR